MIIPFSGIIDEVRLYNHAFTQEQILNDMNFIEANPPNPNPLTWKSESTSINTTTILMSANTATDAENPPVYYYFDFVDSPTGGTGGTDSGWQTGNEYTDTGLQSNHSYGYRVKARDSISTPNETACSSTMYRYTLVSTPGGGSFSTVTQTTIQANWTGNGNRSGTEYYCENINRGTNSGWTSNTYWESTGLTPSQSYNLG